MQGIIILDGADGTGKTTLAKKLCDKIANSSYVHLSKPHPGHAWDEHKIAIINAIKAYRSGKFVVIDRHFLSEAIYGKIYRNGSEYPFAARHVDRLLYRFGAMRVITTAPVNYVIETHKKLVAEREEMYTDRMGEIAQLYIDIWNGGDQSYIEASGAETKGYMEQLIASGGVGDKIGWTNYDVTTDGTRLDKYADKLLNEAQNLQRCVPIFYEEADNLTGWPRKQSIALVGDKVNTGDYDWPFLTNHGSSLYLAKTLNELRADESRICMLNINGPYGLEIMKQVKLACGRVIVLGKEAERRLEQAKISYDAKVRHPLHASRFTNSDNSYSNELRKAFAGFAGVKTA